MGKLKVLFMDVKNKKIVLKPLATPITFLTCGPKKNYKSKVMFVCPFGFRLV